MFWDILPKEVLTYFLSKIKEKMDEKDDIFLTQTLTAGSTSLTFTDERITTDSIIDVYLSVFDVAPTNITVNDGSAVLTFDNQSEDVVVKLRLVN